MIHEVVEFVTDFYKTAFTSLGSITFGIITIPSGQQPVDIPTSAIQVLSTISLILGAIVAILAIINGVFALIKNMKECKLIKSNPMAKKTGKRKPGKKC